MTAAVFTDATRMVEPDAGAIYLRNALSQSFDVQELRNLCFDLGVDYDGLPGNGKDSKAREIVAWFARRDQTDRLVQAVYKLRPNAFWTAAARETEARGSLSNIATGRMLMVQVGRLEVRMDKLEECVMRLRTISTATLTSTIFLMIGLGVLVLVLLTGG